MRTTTGRHRPAPDWRKAARRLGTSAVCHAMLLAGAAALAGLAPRLEVPRVVVVVLDRKAPPPAEPEPMEPEPEVAEAPEEVEVPEVEEEPALEEPSSEVPLDPFMPEPPPQEPSPEVLLDVSWIRPLPPRPEPPPPEEGPTPEALDETEVLVEAVPLAARNEPPVYPAVARRGRGWEGTVEVALVVDAQGRVVSARVLRSSGHEVLDREALRALSLWAFSPATRGGRPVESEVVVPVVFRLRGP